MSNTTERAEMIKLLYAARVEWSLNPSGTMEEAQADTLLTQGWRRGGAEAAEEPSGFGASIASDSDNRDAAWDTPARPSATETLAWAVVAGDGTLLADLTRVNKPSPLVLHDGEHVVRVAIRVVEDGE